MELFYYFFVYSLIGWGLEVAYYAIQTGKLGNSGVLNLPLCPSYGFAMVLLIISMPSLQGQWILQILGFLTVNAVCSEAAYFFARRVTGHEVLVGRMDRLPVATSRFAEIVILSIITAVGVYILHPFVFISYVLLPKKLLNIVLWILGILLVADALILYLLVRRKSIHAGSLHFLEELAENKESLANRITGKVWKRLLKVYPFLTHDLEANAEKLEHTVFAKGVGLYKLFWVFFVTALLGDIIETFYCRIVGGTWMLRSSVLYGPFSFVWGIGAALLTLMLYRLAEKPVKLFIGGFFLGGAYEYMASVVLEVVTGTKFWDYSYMIGNIGGRTNLLFCFFWGILALVWVKLLYPLMSNGIEKIPPLPGAVVTWVLVVLMVLDLGVSGLALVRYTERQKDPVAYNQVQQFLDYHYPDQMIQTAWPNLIVVKD